MSATYPVRFPWVEEVNGTVIGDFTYPYQFWTTDGKRKICQGHFANDDEAVAWFKKNYPDNFKAGADMRCYDAL